MRRTNKRTLLYQLVEEYDLAFKAHLAAQGRDLPRYLEQEFEDHLKCGFLRVRRDSCHAEHPVAFICKKRGFYSGHPALGTSGQPLAVPNCSRRFGRDRHRDLSGLRRGTADIACIEDPVVIEKTLTHLDAKAPEPEAPQRKLFDETGQTPR